MKTLGGAVLVLIVSCLALIPSAAGKTAIGVKILHLSAPLEALAMSGNRVAFDVEGTYPVPNRVFVWNVGTGATTKVSGVQTGKADGSALGGLNRLAIAGDRVAWRISGGGNSEADDEVYSSSLLAPKERRVGSAVREGNQCGAGAGGPAPACAGTWFGGVVASGHDLLVNRWTTDSSGAITGGGLYRLVGTLLKPFVMGGQGVEAVAADSARIAVLQWQWYFPDTAINVYSASGTPLTTIALAAQPDAVELSGRHLLVLEPANKLALYDAVTGELTKTFTLFKNRRAQAVAVHGDVAVYSVPSTYRGKTSVRALNLTTGKDSFVGRLPGHIHQLRMDWAGLAYANDAWNGHGYDVRLVYRPLALVDAAVQ
ncbi:MAG: hypothetical protein QOG85_2272 [Gaiellaceae bacterium]|jgi:hypothetical protein|nr:hypothetical protein [Gaiellaceae bacterium]